MASFRLNGQERTISDSEDTPLLYALRNSFGLNGPKFGCGLAQCAACTVLVDGKPNRSCVTPIKAVAGKEVVTLEGLGEPEKPHALQRAFIKEQAAQCGHCIPGMIMEAKALFDRIPTPTRAEVQAALDEHLCRCGTHNRIIRAILRASKENHA